ncbi:metal-dependent hydrolase [Methanogenium organophilum]|uniref:Metal-dependent hydrolase n=1 Tax=Methanogenium organophilum TaxID=2199 RepID=A0A9X9S2E4_METOG|nr:metal-dependent hydrolase [Methanogenium organophilum]WAI00292.1 metal-dependent hydrolase [Methanogenium organophilum]
MDSFTHAFAIAIPLLLAGNAALVPFAIIGAVIPDIDATFFIIPDDEPSQYIFTHGGVTHSIVGATLLSLVIFCALYFLSGISWFGQFFPQEVTLMAGAAIFAGAMLHIFLDYLAYPGIPLLWPFSTEKFTVGIFPGPSLPILFLSLTLFVLVLTGRAGERHYTAYLAIFLAIILVYGGIAAYANIETNGEAIPTIHPTRWITIVETDESFIVRPYSIPDGTGRETVYQKYLNITPDELAGIAMLPEVKRLYYHSYIVTAERRGDQILLHDPLREEKIFRYPLDHSSLLIPVPEIRS